MTTQKNETVILPSNPDAAQLKTITGWVSRNGLFYGNDGQAERIARWDGCTHVNCSTCGVVIPKSRIRCDPCQLFLWKERHQKREAKKVQPNCTDMIYSESQEQYFENLQEAKEYAYDNGIKLEDMLLLFCEPQYAELLDPEDIYSNVLDEDGDVPLEIQEAFNTLNATLHKLKTVLSWLPGKIAVDLTEESDLC